MAQTPVQTIILPDSDPGITLYTKSLGSVPPLSGSVTVQINETIEKITNINQFVTQEATAVAAGSSHQIQINLNGRLSGDPRLTYDYVSNDLRLEGQITAYRVRTDEFYHINDTPWHFYNNLDTSNYLANHANAITGSTITTGNGFIGTLGAGSFTATDATITGNLTVTGTTTYINTDALNVTDKNIIIAKDAVDALQADGAGITIEGANVTLTYVEASNTFNISHDLVAPNANLGNVVVANYFIGDAYSLNNLPSGNITGQVANANISDQVYNNAQPNITSVGTLLSLTIGPDSGNVNTTLAGNGDINTAGNIYAENISLVANVNAYYANISGDIKASNADLGNTVTANFFTGTLTSNAQPNITSVGNLVSLIVTQEYGRGNIQADNIISSGNIDALNLLGDGYSISNINGANVSTVPYANVANNVSGSDVHGNVQYASYAYQVDGANVMGEVANANSATYVEWTGVLNQPTHLESFSNANTKYITLNSISVDTIPAEPGPGFPGSLTYETTTGVLSFTGATIPSSLSAFSNDPLYIQANSSSQNLTTEQKNNAKTNLGLHAVATYGSYANLSDVPTSLSAFTNDPVYITIGDVSTNGYATTTYVDNAIGNLVDNAPLALDTLNEIANALANDASFSSTITLSLDNRLRIDVDTQNLTPTEKQNAKTNLGLHAVASSGNYNDLENLPALKSVATSGAYSSLTGLPTLSDVSASGSFNDLIDVPNFKTVATSGSYNDLIDVPDFANLYVSRTYFDTVISQIFSLIVNGGNAGGFSSIDGGTSSSPFNTTIDGGVA